jgi:hypothetical protein
MVEDKAEPRDVNWKHLLPWVDLFQGFRVAMDLNKLLLAAAGILVMAFGWWLLAVIFDGPKPDWKTRRYDISTVDDKIADTPEKKQNVAWQRFKEDRERWNLLHETAGAEINEEKVESIEPGDVASDPAEFEDLSKEYAKLREKWKETGFRAGSSEIARIDRKVQEGKLTADQAKLEKLGVRKPAGRLRTWPWYEDRGPNPFLLVTGETGAPWEEGHFWDWLLTKEVPVLIEPLVKLLLPVRYFFKSSAGAKNKFYFLLVTIWTLLTWSFFGGAITRIASVQVTRQEKIGLMEAVRFTCKRFLSYMTAPLFPMAFMLVLVVVMILYGFLHWIPGVGELIDGLFWWLMVVFGLIMAVLLVGLVSWPMMSAAVSTEGTDSWEAVSRSYSYLIQAPWHFLWYNLVALAYGAAIIFFVGLMGSLMVFLAKWGVSQNPALAWGQREPAYLFVYSPTSFGWRELLLQGVTVNTDDGKVIPLVDHGIINEPALEKYRGSFAWYNSVGASLVSAVWMNLIFLLVIGFGYSYFWSASTIIYLLMRKKVDDAEMDEVYLEEDEQEASYTPPTPPAGTSPAPSTGPSLTMVEPPSLRPSTPPPPTPDEPSKPESAPTTSGSANGGPPGDGPAG